MATDLDAALAEEANYHLIGVFLLLLLSGFYIHTFVDSMVVMFRRRAARDSQPWWLVAAALFLFFDLLLDIITVMIRAYQGLRIVPGACKESQPSYFKEQSSPLAIIPDVCLIVGILLTDGIIIYRTYIVWGSRLVVVALPILIWVANTGTVIWVLIGLVKTAPTSSVLEYLISVLRRVTVTSVLTLLLNVLCSGLIVWKILRESAGRSSRGSRAHKAVEVLVQSTGVWCAALIALIIAAGLRSTIFFIVLDCMMPIMTTVFSLIIVRLWRQSAGPRTTQRVDEISDLRFTSSTDSDTAAQLTTLDVIEMSASHRRSRPDRERGQNAAASDMTDWHEQQTLRSVDAKPP